MPLELEQLEENKACQVDMPGTGGNKSRSQTSEAALERFPNVLNKISGLWGTRDLDKLIDELIMDSREGSRQGFPVEVAEELLLLGGVNKYVRALEIADHMHIDVKKALQMVNSGDQAHQTSDPWTDSTLGKEAAFDPARRSLNKSAAPVVQENFSLYENKDNKSGSNALVWVLVAIVAGIIYKFVVPLISK